MSGKTLGYLTLKVPVIQDIDNGTFTDPPEEYLYLGKAELVEHDLPEKDVPWLAQEAYTGDLMMNFELPVGQLSDLAEAIMDKQEKLPLPKRFTRLLGED